jgi:hypothetical protein
VWSYDFLTERTEDGRQLRILVVIDEFTRECLAIEVGRSFTARDVIMTLQYLFPPISPMRSPQSSTTRRWPPASAATATRSPGNVARRRAWPPSTNPSTAR